MNANRSFAYYLLLIAYSQMEGLLNHQPSHKPQRPQAITESIKCPCIADQGTLYQLCSI